MKTSILFPACFLLFAVTAPAATYYVPDEFSTIQGAISDPMVVDGDTIIVCPGTYAENINFLGKALILESETGPQATVLQGDGTGMVVALGGFTTPGALLEGFTVTGGVQGIWCTVSDWNENPSIIGNLVAHNDYGIYGYEGAPELIEGNTISYNDKAGLLIDGNMYGCNASIIRGNTIAFNGSASSSNGGGIHVRSANPCSIDRNVIIGNYAKYQGGGIWYYPGKFGGTMASFTGNVLAFNSAGESGGGLVLSNCWCTKFSNNTFYGNSAQEAGGAIDAIPNSNLDIENSLFWGNTASSGPTLNLPGGEAAFRYCDVQNGADSVWTESGAVLDWGDGMFSQPPKVVNPAAYDFHLLSMSPCVNRGTNECDAALDMDGEAIPFMGTADVGADEFTGAHLFSGGSFAISAQTGGSVAFDLRAGVEEAGRPYLVLGSLSGTAPGTALPGGLAVLPLNVDVFTLGFVLPLLNTALFQSFLGSLDTAGQAQACLNSPPLPPDVVGLTLHFAYALATPFDLASNPLAVLIEP